MRDALRAEWSKICTLPGQTVSVLFVAVLTAGGSAAAVAVGGSHPPDPVQLGLLGVRIGQAAAAIAGVRIIAGEYGSGLLGTTLLALPRRLRVFAAKAILLTAGVLGAALIGVLASVAFARLSLTDGPVLRAVADSVIYLVLIGLLSLGLGAVFRSAVAGVGTVLGLLYLTPLLIGLFSNEHVRHFLYRSTPATALYSLQATVDVSGLPMGPGAALWMVAAWAATGLATGAWALCRRDA